MRYSLVGCYVVNNGIMIFAHSLLRIRLSVNLDKSWVLNVDDLVLGFLASKLDLTVEDLRQRLGLWNSDSGLPIINDGYGRFPPGSFMGRPEQMRINVQWGPPRERFQGMESLCTITPCVCLQWVSAHTDTSGWTPPQHFTQKLKKLSWEISSTQCYCCDCGQLWNLLLPLLWEKVEDVSSFGPAWAFW